MKFTLSFLVAALVATMSVSDVAEARNKNKGFCGGSRLPPGKGFQLTGGFCSDTQQGEIPSTKNMVSTLILEPRNGGKVQAGKPFDVTVQTRNLLTGHFSDPANGTYYTKSQKLQGGKILGHNHITVQFLGSAQEDPDPATFTFFKGLNAVSDKEGKFTQTVDPIKKLGLHRVCTMTSSFTHQPLLMPVAKRGAQDDCVRFTVVKKL